MLSRRRVPDRRFRHPPRQAARSWGFPTGAVLDVSQYEYWKHAHLTVDVVPGRGGGFSLESPEGVRFLIRSRLLTEDEMAHFGLS